MFFEEILNLVAYFDWNFFLTPPLFTCLLFLKDHSQGWLIIYTLNEFLRKSLPNISSRISLQWSCFSFFFQAFSKICFLVCSCSSLGFNWGFISPRHISPQQNTYIYSVVYKEENRALHILPTISIHTISKYSFSCIQCKRRHSPVWLCSVLVICIANFVCCARYTQRKHATFHFTEASAGL